MQASPCVLSIRIGCWKAPGATCLIGAAGPAAARPLRKTSSARPRLDAGVVGVGSGSLGRSLQQPVRPDTLKLRRASLGRGSDGKPEIYRPWQ
jgi:hypothetical protein